jgi:soluble lytic murein transglycosylase
MKRFLLIALLSALPVVAVAQSIAITPATLRAALQAAESGQPGPAIAANHPLAAWIEMAGLRKRIDTLGTAQAQTFLSTHAGTPVGEAFRDVWLGQTAKRADWAAFTAAWQPRSDTTLRCAQLQAALATGQPGADWNSQAQALWRTAGQSLPDRCDAVIDALASRGGMSDALRWERFDAAVASGQPAIMRRAARGLPAAALALATDYAAFLDAPHTRTAQWPRDGRSRAVTTAGLAALARKDPQAARSQLPAVASALALTPEQQGKVRYQIALWTVASYLPGSAQRMAEVPAAAWDERLHEWQVREAMARSDWAAALAALQRMPASQRNDSRWQWFTARMLEKTGQATAADAMLRQAARASTFHGFMAADRLRQPYALCPLELDAKAPVRAQVAANPALQRALLLQQIDRPGWAAAEWQYALKDLDDTQRQHAVALASAAGWFDRAVFALKGEQEMRLYSLRFPLHHGDTIRAQAATNGLDPAWVAAEIRAESTFNSNARSPANALGLMQVIPATGQAVANRLGLANYTGANSLYDPDINITIGTAYLRELKAKYGNLPYVTLAAYNAGPTPTGRWLAQRGDFDPDIWIETISYKETRDYVARVLAFSVIYDWRLNGRAVSLADRIAGRLGEPTRGFSCPD